MARAAAAHGILVTLLLVGVLTSSSSGEHLRGARKALLAARSADDASGRDLLAIDCDLQPSAPICNPPDPAPSVNYYVVKGASTYSDALASCQKAGPALYPGAGFWGLASFSSASQYDSVMLGLYNKGAMVGGSRYWMGLRWINLSWRWVDTNAVTTFTKWAAGSPNSPGLYPAVTLQVNTGSTCLNGVCSRPVYAGTSWVNEDPNILFPSWTNIAGAVCVAKSG